jgi:glycosyltransferase involved in cell wall biosynthesis
MKVLLTTHQFFPQFTTGTEVLTLSVARELVRRGHEVRVYTGYPSDKCLLDNERFDEYEFEGIHVYRFHHAYVPMGGQVSLIEIGYDNRLGATYFEKIMQGFIPDVVHFFHLNRLGTRLIEKANLVGIPAFMTLTDFWPICPTGQLLLPDGRLCKGPNPYAGNCVKHLAQSTQQNLSGIAAKWMPMALANLLSRLTFYGFLPSYPHQTEVKAIGARLGINISRLNQLKKIVAPNSMMREVLITNGVDPDLIFQSAYGVDVLESNTNSLPRVHRQPFRIGYIGTLARHKGCHVLIEAFKALPRERAILKIYGNLKDFPEYLNELKLLAAGHDSIEFCGTFPNSTILQVLADLDVLVVPSIWPENTPLVIYSSQAARCPVVASDLPGISEVISNEQNGLLFEPQNSVALTRQLLRLIEEPSLVSKLSDNAKHPKSTSIYVDELLTIWKSTCEI